MTLTRNGVDTEAELSYFCFPAPSVARLTPAYGPVGGGTVVTVAGGPFGGATAGARCRFGAFEKDAVAAKLVDGEIVCAKSPPIDGAIAGLSVPQPLQLTLNGYDYFPSAAHAPRTVGR